MAHCGQGHHRSHGQGDTQHPHHNQFHGRDLSIPEGDCRRAGVITAVGRRNALWEAGDAIAVGIALQVEGEQVGACFGISWPVQKQCAAGHRGNGAHATIFCLRLLSASVASVPDRFARTAEATGRPCPAGRRGETPRLPRPWQTERAPACGGSIKRGTPCCAENRRRVPVPTDRGRSAGLSVQHARAQTRRSLALSPISQDLAIQTQFAHESGAVRGRCARTTGEPATQRRGEPAGPALHIPARLGGDARQQVGVSAQVPCHDGNRTHAQPSRRGVTSIATATPVIPASSMACHGL